MASARSRSPASGHSGCCWAGNACHEEGDHAFATSASLTGQARAAPGELQTPRAQARGVGGLRNETAQRTQRIRAALDVLADVAQKKRGTVTSTSRLDELGFDSLWVSERISGHSPDPVVAMAFCAGRTKKTKFGMSVMVLPGQYKPFDQFHADDLECRQYASVAIGAASSSSVLPTPASCANALAPTIALLGCTVKPVMPATRLSLPPSRLCRALA